MMHVLRGRVLKSIVMVSMMVLVMSCSSDDETPDIQRIMLDKINSIRMQGCTCGSVQYSPSAPVVLNVDLSAAAYAHASDMFHRDYFSHISPDGISPEDRAAKAGYPGTLLAENIAEGYNTIDDTIAAWLNSVSHCEALMTVDANEMGVAHVNTYWVLELGKQN